MKYNKIGKMDLTAVSSSFSPLGLQQSSEVLKEMTKKMKVLHLDKDQFRLFIHFIFLKPDEVFTSSYQILPYLHSRSSS